ncbi:MAG: hypothetical protein HY735_27460 [Verrucomicrobia bacterium]|nr:hypothetical protein [Verrucomicrobiota bacterium]
MNSPLRPAAVIALTAAAYFLVNGMRAQAATPASFEGKFFSGRGDVEYLRLLDIARRMFDPDPEFQNLSMLYTTNWNGLVEGPTWDAWWIQNSYGTTYAALPFVQEPFVTFLQNSQDLWFDQMGDGKRVGAPPPMNWVAPDGALCDAARPGWIVYKQGDGRIGIHDWGMEFTAAGIVMQAEWLLISRDREAIAKYLPRLERSANFIETRRDPTNNLFLAGPAGNLLAPSYAGWKKPDGTYGPAYLAGLSVTYIAALDRLIELAKLAGDSQKAKLYKQRRDDAKKGLALVTTDEGYFIRSLDPDGVRHGVFGAAHHGYFEASPNHDAIAFRVVADAQAERIFQKIASIPGLRPHHFVLPNYPSYDDMYEKPEGLWAFGTWVNGGHWSTCEARMMLGYYRLGRFEDARHSMRQLLTFAEKFRMDNPLVKCGSDVYQPKQPINLTYDAFGPPAAFIRGLFEYLYHADGLTLIPHIPETITELEQNFQIRFGKKQLFLSTVGRGSITGVRVNGRAWNKHDATSVFLPYDETPNTARIEILLGGVKPQITPSAKAATKLAGARLLSSPGISPDSKVRARRESRPTGSSVRPGRVLTTAGPLARYRQSAAAPSTTGAPDSVSLEQRAAKLRAFLDRMKAAGLGAGYEAAHAQLALDAIATIPVRRRLLAEGKLKPLPELSQAAADKSYVDAATKLRDGLENIFRAYEDSDQPQRRRMHQLWMASQSD